MKDKRIVVTGGKGFLGKHVVSLLKESGYKYVEVPLSSVYDLRTKDDITKMFQVLKPDVVIHLAARVGGIGYNELNPASLFYDNLIMGTQLLHESYLRCINKFVAIGTVCSYPKYTEPPFKEENLWDGYPEETNAPYGLAKKMLLVQSQAYRKQYGFNSIFLLPVNLYGPGDNFNPESSHVIPALIKKFRDAKKANSKEVILWGTGIATREFLYVEDAARAIVLATEQYNKSEPINLGSGVEIKISELATIIKELIGYRGDIIYDSTKPDGQPKRNLDTTKAVKEFNFVAETNLYTGLKKTILWYLSN